MENQILLLNFRVNYLIYQPNDMCVYTGCFYFLGLYKRAKKTPCITIPPRLLYKHLQTL